ncbi:MAG: hypothetical protein AcusKO_40050 [Acuticoccus sp.]
MLFNNCETIEAVPFARLPEAMRPRGVRSEWREGQPAGTPDHSLLEGPSYDRDGNLWIVDVAYGRIFRVTPDGTFHLAIQYDGEPNGLAIHRDGRIFVADYKNGIMVFDPRAGTIARFFDRYRLEHLKAVNDLTFSTTGDLYFTDQGLTGLHDPTGRVFRVRPDGSADLLLNKVPSPNAASCRRTVCTPPTPHSAARAIAGSSSPNRRPARCWRPTRRSPARRSSASSERAPRHQAAAARHVHGSGRADAVPAARRRLSGPCAGARRRILPASWDRSPDRGRGSNGPR